MPIWLLLLLGAAILLIVAQYGTMLPPEIRAFCKLVGIVVLVAAVFFFGWAMWLLVSSGDVHP